MPIGLPIRVLSEPQEVLRGGQPRCKTCPRIWAGGVSMGRDRRYRERSIEGPIQMLCRECYSPIDLRPERISLEDGHAIYRCQRCQLAFVVRSDDAAAVLATATSSEVPAEA